MKKEIEHVLEMNLLRVPIISLCGGLWAHMVELLLDDLVVKPLTAIGKVDIPFATGVTIFSMFGYSEGRLLAFSHFVVWLWGLSAILACGAAICRKLSLRDCFLSCSIVSGYIILYRLVYSGLSARYWDGDFWPMMRYWLDLFKIPIKMYQTFPYNYLLDANAMDLPPALLVLFRWLYRLMPFLYLPFAIKIGKRKEDPTADLPPA